MRKGKLLFITMLAIVTFGYVFFAGSDIVNGKTLSDSKKLNVHFTNVHNIVKGGFASDSGDGLTAARIDEKNGDVINFLVALRQPGDRYSFDVDVKNYGLSPVKVNLVISELDDNAKQYLNWSVVGINPDERIASNESKTLTVVLEYKPEVTVLPSEAFNSNFNVQVDAVEE